MLLEDCSSGGDVEDLDDSSIVLFGVVQWCGEWGRELVEIIEIINPAPHHRTAIVTISTATAACSYLVS